MLYQITQQAVPKSDKDLRSRTIKVDLPDRIHAIAIELQIDIIIEITADLISLEATFGNNRLTKIAKLELPGFTIGNDEYPGPQRVCIALIEEAYDITQ